MSNKYSTESAQEIGEKILKVHPGFPFKSFVDAIASGADIVDALRAHLPTDYPKAVDILLRLLGPEHPSEEGMFKNHWQFQPFLRFVEKYGFDDFDASMRALYEITKRYTSRDVLRNFLTRYRERTMVVLHGWAQDTSPHVRRLVSDATRPRLPARKALLAFIEDPRPLLDLLGRLKNDPSPVVRKSIAGNLSDIIKDNPDIVYETLERWQPNASKETQQIIRNALSYSIKKGDPRALNLLGYGEPKVTLHNLKLEPKILRVGDSLTFLFILQSETQATQNLIIDYVVYYMTATGKISPKVYKLSQRALKGGKKIGIQKEHSFEPLFTRRFYAGRHRLEIQVNGKILGGIDFNLELGDRLD